MIRDLVVAVLLASLGIGSISVGTINVEVNRDVTPVEARNGWDPSLVDPNTPATELRAVGTLNDTGKGAIVKLWDFSKAINGGKHFPIFRQLIGDCVANGAANAINYRQAVQIARENPDLEFRPANRPWIYGVSRCDPEIGKGRLGRSDGSVGDWARRAVEMRGVLADDHPDVPPYSAAVAKEWGFKGAPQKFYAIAKDFPVHGTAKVTTYEEVRDALANGYPVTIASNVGFDMQPVVRDGKHWGKRSGSWNHQMCLIGIDDTAVSPFDRKTGAAYCQNSWGESAHGQPADDAPPGGFWIDRTTVEKIVGQGDSWAFSSFEGFKPRDLNFNVFGAGPPVAVAHFPTEAAPLAPLSEALCGLQGGYAQILGGSASLASALTLLMAARRRRRSATTLAA